MKFIVFSFLIQFFKGPMRVVWRRQGGGGDGSKGMVVEWWCDGGRDVMVEVEVEVEV